MTIGFMDDLECHACGVAVKNGFELHELLEDEWFVICTDCVLVLELDGGK